MTIDRAAAKRRSGRGGIGRGRATYGPHGGRRRLALTCLFLVALAGEGCGDTASTSKQVKASSEPAIVSPRPAVSSPRPAVSSAEPSASSPAKGALLEGEGKGPRPGYVPKDLDDAHRELSRMLSKEDLDAIRAAGDDLSGFHFSLGLWIRNNWLRSEGSPLAGYFVRLGAESFDDMSAIILKSFARKLHGQPFVVGEAIAEYKEYWRSMATPSGGSPKDGSKITWRVIKGSGQGAVHLGVSRQGRDHWRYEYGSGHGIEPARPDEGKELDGLPALR